MCTISYRVSSFIAGWQYLFEVDKDYFFPVKKTTLASEFLEVAILLKKVRTVVYHDMYVWCDGIFLVISRSLH